MCQFENEEFTIHQIIVPLTIFKFSNLQIFKFLHTLHTTPYPPFILPPIPVSAPEIFTLKLLYRTAYEKIILCPRISICIISFIPCGLYTS